MYAVTANQSADVAAGNEPLEGQNLHQSVPPSAIKIVDVCRTLGIRVTSSDIERWVGGAGGVGLELAAKHSSDFLSRLLLKLQYEIEPDPADQNAPDLRGPTREYLLKNLPGAPSALEEVTARIPNAPLPAYARRTKMNTSENRSPSLDRPILRYFEECKPTSPVTLVDIGVGYPPITTIHTAKIVTGMARVIGIDTTMPDLCVEFPSEGDEIYVVFYELDSAQNQFVPIYALREDSTYPDMTAAYHEIQDDERDYVVRKAESLRRTLMSDLGESIYADMTVLYRDLDQNSAEPESARDTLARFYKTADIERDGTSLKFQPMRRKSAELPNLEFRKDNFRLATIEEADLIRLGNVLLPEYYSRQEAVAALHSFGSKLREGGRIVLGSGATFTLTYEKKGGEILPLRATVKIIEGQPPHYSGLTMPGTKGLRHAVQEALDSLPIFEIDLAAPMGVTRAEKVRKLIEAKGYRVEAVFNSATWLEIDLTGRE